MVNAASFNVSGPTEAMELLFRPSFSGEVSTSAFDKDHVLDFSLIVPIPSDLLDKSENDQELADWKLENWGNWRKPYEVDMFDMDDGTTEVSFWIDNDEPRAVLEALSAMIPHIYFYVDGSNDYFEWSYTLLNGEVLDFQQDDVEDEEFDDPEELDDVYDDPEVDELDEEEYETF